MRCIRRWKGDSAHRRYECPCIRRRRRLAISRPLPPMAGASASEARCLVHNLAYSLRIHARDDPSARYAPALERVRLLAVRRGAARLAGIGYSHPDPATRRCGRRSDRGVTASGRQSDARRTHGHPHARAWNCANLYAGRRFQPVPVCRSDRSASIIPGHGLTTSRLPIRPAAAARFRPMVLSLRPSFLPSPG